MRSLICTLVLLAGAAPGSALAQKRLALVRFVPSQSPPPGWLELEEATLAALGERLSTPPIPASKAADVWEVPGYRFDRAQLLIRESLLKAEEALAAGDARATAKQLKDIDDLLDLSGVVALMPATLLRRHHRLGALATTEGEPGRTAMRNYLALLEVQPDDALDAERVLRAERERDDVQPAGIVVEVSHPNSKVFVDGVLVGGRSVRRYDLPPGRHYLRVVSPDRIAHGERLTLRPGQILRRTLELERGEDPLAAKAAALQKNVVERPAAKQVSQLGAALDADGLMLMFPDARKGAVLRLFDVGSATFGDPVTVTFEARGDALGALVDQSLGRAPPPPPVETITAVSDDVTRADPLTDPTIGAVDESDSSRWWWIAGGAAVVVVVGVVIAVVASSGSEPGRAPVWICPGEPCAP